MRSASLCHPPKPGVAHGLCRSCYERQRRRDHPEEAKRRDAVENSRRKPVSRTERHLAAERRYKDKNWEMLNQKARAALARDPVHRWEISLRHRFGISAADWMALYEAQDGRCAICGSERTWTKREARFHTDHDHATGRVRGLLCSNCNTKLEWFEKHSAAILSYLA